MRATDTGQPALWSAQEVQTQAEQCPGQVTVWEALDELSAQDYGNGHRVIAEAVETEHGVLVPCDGAL